MMKSPIGAAAAIVATILIVPSAATAVDRCSVKQDKKTGNVLVSAQNVSGTLRVGYRADWIVTPIALDASDQACIANGTAKDCVIGTQGADSRTTLPPACELYLEDAESTCTATIKRCVAGLRPACPPDMERLGSGCIDRFVNTGLEWVDAVNACHDRGRSLCSVEQLHTCDATNVGSGTPLTCASYTDNGGTLWTLTSFAGDGQNVFSYTVRYGGDNIMSVQSSTSGGIYDFFCCSALGTP